MGVKKLRGGRIYTLIFVMALPVAALLLCKGCYMRDEMKNCRLCPRECEADRTAGRYGVCRAGAEILVARAALHAWEEPVISGKNGSGAVFFSGCSLGCIYCQNYIISGTAAGRRQTGTADHTQTDRMMSGTADTDPPESLPGKSVSVEQLADIFLRLQDFEKANNINLVTATHFIPQAAEALKIAKKKGLEIPVVYNTSGYEKVSSLKMLDGLVDVYLPDLKYVTPELARKYSHARDYPDRAKEAIEEMVRQTGEPRFRPEQGNEENQLIIRGVIVRNLLLPGHVEESKKIVKYLHETYKESIYISLMNQYTPMPAMEHDPLLGRRVTKREYERLVQYALEIGVVNGFIQEGKTAQESFIPAWNGEGTG